MTLPNLAIRPVTESDSAGTNFVLEEWCIDEQPALWAAFANQREPPAGGQADGVAISADQPESNWPGAPRRPRPADAPAAVAGNIADQRRGHRRRAGPVRHRPRLRAGNPAKGVAVGEERQRQLHPAHPGRRGLGPGLRHPAAQRDPPAQLQRHRPQRLQPVDLQLPADHRPPGGEPAKGAVHERASSTTPSPSASRQSPELRLRLPRAVARAVRDQAGDRRRARCGGGHRGRERRLRLR